MSLNDLLLPTLALRHVFCRSSLRFCRFFVAWQFSVCCVIFFRFRFSIDDEIFFIDYCI